MKVGDLVECNYNAGESVHSWTGIVVEVRSKATALVYRPLLPVKFMWFPITTDDDTYQIKVLNGSR